MYSIRYYEYLDEYLELLLKYYATEQKGILCTYWHINFDESVIEDFCHTNTGSYEIIGNRSGYLWDKIHMLPVYYSEDTSIDKEFDENGIRRDINISVTIPSRYGIIPTALDFLFFNSRVQLEDEVVPIFRVRGISESHFGKHKFYKLNLNTDYLTVDNLDEQTINNFVFVEILKKIYSLDDSEILLKSIQTIKGLSDINSEYFNRKLVCYD